MSEEQEFPVQLTERAVEQARKLAARDARPDAFIRLGVKGGGCSGLEYIIRMDTRSLPLDKEAVFEGVRIVCDVKSAQYLKGSTLEYTGNLIGGGFRFDNPNAERSCGCGTSFTLKSKTPKA